MKYPLAKLPVVYVRVAGLNGKTMEVRAIVSTGATECIITTRDALELGYTIPPDLYSRSEKASKEGIETTVTAGYLVDMARLLLKEVRVGDLSVKDVEALAWDIPENAGVDAVVGVSFLKNFRMTVNFKEGFFEIEP
jgi:predicted aspartyl protease